jgi:hypothetical protein
VLLGDHEGRMSEKIANSAPVRLALCSGGREKSFGKRI